MLERSRQEVQITQSLVATSKTETRENLRGIAFGATLGGLAVASEITGIVPKSFNYPQLIIDAIGFIGSFHTCSLAFRELHRQFIVQETRKLEKALQTARLKQMVNSIWQNPKS